ncbi:MAG: asparagine synthase (glutamine-hydrolyzing) [Phycisphaerae bacterium]
MCGIAGICKWTHEQPAPWAQGNRSSLDPMLKAIAHRGPDGSGVFVDSRLTHTVALLHARLAVIDLACGQQPMGNEDGNVQVVFNGEIYNHLELRAELEKAGHRFKTDHSDTEVLVHGWEEWGTELPKKLLGMFAFAVWDAKAETLFLCRDRMGQKPLFYGTLEDGLVFGSTIPSVLAWHEVPRRVPMEQIGLYLLLGYFPGPQTVWRDVSRVLPGGWVRVRKDLVDGGVYWNPGSETAHLGAEKGGVGGGEGGVKGGQRGDPWGGKCGAVRGLVREAVGSQLVSDVPVSCFLSGGIDSSIIAAVMQEEVRKLGGEAIRTVSVGFRESGFDETEYARAVAEKIGSRHLRIEVDARADVFGVLEMLMRTSLGEPYADSSIVPTYHLSKAARGVGGGATVALSGDGADELFGGYDRYRAMMMMARWGGSGRLLAHLVPRAVGNREKYRRFVAAARAGILSERYTRLVEIFPIDLAEEVLGADIMDWYPLPEEYGLDEDASALRFSMRRDQQEYLPGDVLWKVDSASMSPGVVGPLEVRSPFLDHRVVEMANGLLDSDYVRGGVGKFILREAFAELLPPVVKGRGKKGFGVPVGEWFRGGLRDSVRDLLLARDSFCSMYLRKGVVERVVGEHLCGEREHTHRVFALVMLEMWWREFRPGVEKTT